MSLVIKRKLGNITSYNQWVYDLNPTNECRCRFFNGKYADVCYLHYARADHYEKRVIDEQMEQVKATVIKGYKPQRFWWQQND